MRDLSLIFLGAVGLLALEIAVASLWVWWLAVGEWLEYVSSLRFTIGLPDWRAWGRARLMRSGLWGRAVFAHKRGWMVRR